MPFKKSYLEFLHDRRLDHLVYQKNEFISDTSLVSRYNKASDMNGTSSDEVVKAGLANLIKDPDLTIDDIVLSYVTGILDDLVDNDALLDKPDNSDDLFDSEGFCEMLVAYLPEAGKISAKNITAWMIQMAQDHRAALNKDKENKDSFDLKSCIPPAATKGASPRSKTSSESSDCSGTKMRLVSESEEEFEILVARLLEMFPYSCDLEVGHCLTLMNGDVERTSNLIMHRHESGQSLKPEHNKRVSRMRGFYFLL